ncbi:MAG: UDP-N-acetylmuramoyl-tripeptide--D-alanyl-D-alanine ligase [Clostridia bacterium]|nr:UDP-N-acetylmuramoyl-tripeptide--D-alanyl-D-alanine ligase [Clostridia bacterium]
MEPVTLGFVAKSVAGRLDGDAEMPIVSVSTDTRAVEPGCLFIALAGERYDGHDFVGEAFAKGAAAALVHKPVDVRGPTVMAPDTSRALLALASAYRGLFSLPVCGVTGSVGKTSTKEMVYAVLSRRYKTHKNEGNRNNAIGMPMSVFGLKHSHGAAVFEMGMSALGEISQLSHVARPRIGIITNIGVSHIEMLGSREAILRAKLEIADGMEPDGVLLLNGDDPLLLGASRTAPRKVVTFSIENTSCDYTAVRIEPEGAGLRFVIRSYDGVTPAKIPVIGTHNVYNALAAFAAGRLLGVSPWEAARGLCDFKTQGQRQLMTEWRGATLIEDCYNASPDSMRAAFSVLAAVGSGGRRIAVLADMLELGSHSAETHLAVGKMAAESGVDLLFAYGDEARRVCEGFHAARPGTPEACQAFEDKQALAQRLEQTVVSGDTLLFKGSRGMRLEEVIESLRATELK